MQLASARPERKRARVSTTSLRALHANVSAFIAPTILFFALSGILQILGLQDPHGGYTPSALVSSIARLHKEQVFAPEPQRQPPPNSSRGDGPPRAKQAPSPATLALKALFILEALALAATTLAGIAIGVTHPKRARTCWLLLGAGIVVPLGLALA